MEHLAAAGFFAALSLVLGLLLYMVDRDRKVIRAERDRYRSALNAILAGRALRRTQATASSAQTIQVQGEQ